MIKNNERKSYIYQNIMSVSKKTPEVKIPTKKDGTEDKRYTTEKVVKKDGTADKRYKPKREKTEKKKDKKDDERVKLSPEEEKRRHEQINLYIEMRRDIDVKHNNWVNNLIKNNKSK